MRLSDPFPSFEDSLHPWSAREKVVHLLSWVGALENEQDDG